MGGSNDPSEYEFGNDRDGQALAVETDLLDSIDKDISSGSDVADERANRIAGKNSGDELQRVQNHDLNQQPDTDSNNMLDNARQTQVIDLSHEEDEPAFNEVIILD